MNARLGILAASTLMVLAACRSGPARASDETPPRAPVSTPVEQPTLDPYFEPALEGVRAAIAEGDDEAARAILERLLLREPDGATLATALGYQRILDGRRALAGVSMRVVARLTPPADPSAPFGVQVALVASTRDGVARVLEPGPATLVLSWKSVVPSGSESSSVETRHFDLSEHLSVAADRPAQIELARFPMLRPPGVLALHLTVELELRAGSVIEDTRTLPALHIHVDPGEATLVSSALAEKGEASVGELLELCNRTAFESHEALEIAVRIAPARRAEALRELGLRVADLSEPTLDKLAAALRWLDPAARAGADSLVWRARLRGHARAARDESRLKLPRRSTGTARAGGIIQAP